MTAIKPLFCAAALAAAAFSSPALAIVDAIDVGYGTKVSTSTWGNCPSFCRGDGVEFGEDGGAGITASSASESTYGTARGSAAFASGSSYLPVLKGYGSSGLGRRAGSTSFASQQFTYSGGSALEVTMDVSLTGTVVDGASGYVSNDISADIAIVVAQSIPWMPSFSTLIFEALPFDAVVFKTFVAITNPGVSAAAGSLTFDLNPGDTFFVVSQLNVGAQNGTADAEHTLVMAFDPVTAAAPGLVAATAPVPEPGTAWFLGLGLLAVGWQARRRIAGR